MAEGHVIVGLLGGGGGGLELAGYVAKSFVQHLDEARPVLISIVNFTNILQAVFAPISFCQIVTNSNCKHLKAAQNTFVQKSCA